MLAGFKQRAGRSIRRIANPISQSALRKAIDSATGGGCDTLYVHSGISGIGHFWGGPCATLGSLAAACDNLFLPTHTYNYPEAPGEPAPVFDCRTTPCPEMGILANEFWQQPRVVRSIHSTHSLAGRGPLAEEICARHYDSFTPCGEGTPYSRLVHRGASALMLGVSFRYYTPFHTAECEAGSPSAIETGTIDRLRYLDETGGLREHNGQRQNRFDTRFHEAGELLERKGLVRRIPLGRSALLFVRDMANVHELLIERLKQTPDFLRASCMTELA